MYSWDGQLDGHIDGHIPTLCRVSAEKWQDNIGVRTITRPPQSCYAFV